MKRITDIKNAMKVGTKWHVYCHPLEKSLGVMVVTRIQSNAFLLKPENSKSKTEEKEYHWPKQDEVIYLPNDKGFTTIDEDGIKLFTYSAPSASKATMGELLDTIELKFDIEPTPADVAELEEAGFKFSKARHLWYAHKNPHRLEVASKMAA